METNSAFTPRSGSPAPCSASGLHRDSARIFSCGLPAYPVATPIATGALRVLTECESPVGSASGGFGLRVVDFRFQEIFFSSRNPCDPVTISRKTLEIVSFGLSGFFRFFQVSLGSSVLRAFGLFGSVQICWDAFRAVRTENGRWSSLLSLASSSPPDANQCTALAFCARRSRVSELSRWGRWERAKWR